MRRIVALGLVGMLAGGPAPDARGDGPKALTNRDREVIGGLIAVLGKPGAPARIEAARGLRWIGPPARDAVPSLVAMLDDEDAQVAETAADALLEIGADHPLVGPALAGALSDPRPEARIKAMSTIQTRSRTW
jgi:HEAT repeat protein